MVKRMGQKFDRQLKQVAYILRRHFSNFHHHNKKNPLDELLFILCSTTTTYPVYLRTYNALKGKYPTSSKLNNASVVQIAKTIREGGQFTQKATAIKAILKALTIKFGRPTLAPLKRMDDEQCEEFLTSLPRVGKKVARCVMLFSLNRQVFPVDTHCWRICKRLGWIKGDKKPTDEGGDELQSVIPPGLRYSLHVNLISLGREFCKSRNPLCRTCPVSSLCPKIGLDKRTHKN